MARVFAVPRYAGQTENAWITYREWPDVDSNIRRLAALGLAGFDIDTSLFNEGLAKPSPKAAAYDRGLRMQRESIEAIGKCVRAVEDALGSVEWKFDEAAVFGWFTDVLEGRVRFAAGIGDHLVEAEHVAKAVATAGMVASFCTPATSHKSVKAVGLFAALRSAYPNIAAAYACSETWMHGLHSGAARDHMQEIRELRIAADASKLRIVKGGWVKSHVGCQAFHIGPFVCIERDRIAYVFDATAKRNLHDVIWSLGGWAMACLNGGPGHSTGDGGYGLAFADTLAYVRKALRRLTAEKRSPYELARQMKSSYGIILARYRVSDADDEERNVVREQIHGMRSEMAAKGYLEPYWCDVVASWPDNVQIDLGTAWHLLPPDDVSPSMLDEAVSGKMNDTRVADPAAVDSFIKYSMSAISAHLAAVSDETEGEWEYCCADHKANIPEWITSCQHGTVMYAPSGCHCRVTRVFDWIEHMNHWHWSAQDVTHVSARLGDYSSPAAVADLAPDDINELTYVMRHGAKLSGEWTPNQVRRNWAAGRATGDAVSVMAGKSENTKFGRDVRDTHSGCDTLREPLTEIDRNLSRLARVVPGCCMRLGRAGLERALHGLFKDSNEADGFLAIDVSGWSPNMVRSVEMQFMDNLMRFFKTDLRASPLFGPLSVVTARAGYHNIWIATDGSIQGWFGTGDTIMHSLLVQWAYARIREEGVVARHTGVAKQVLIDDCIARLRGARGAATMVLKRVEHWYLKLGFRVDPVKTLFSLTKGHFLNRLYRNGLEVLCPTKVFAKADREFETPYPSVWELVDSALTAFVGAADRGFDPVVAYTAGIWRAITVAIGRKRMSDFTGEDFTLFGAFLPRNLGGWGLPTACQWLSKEASRADTSGLCAIATIARQLEDGGQNSGKLVHLLLEAVEHIALRKRSAEAALDDPCGVSASIAVDVSSARRIAISRAAEFRVRDATFARLLSLAKDTGYSSVLETNVIRQGWPAALVAAFAECLPHAVIRKITARIEGSQVICHMLRYQDRHKLSMAMRIANRSAVVRFRLIRARTDATPRSRASGSQVANTLIARQMALDGTYFQGTTQAGILDIIGQSSSESTIGVYFPAHSRDSLATGEGLDKASIIRSCRTKPISMKDTHMLRDPDPITLSANTLGQVVSIARGLNLDADHLAGVYTLLWTGEYRRDITPELPVTHVNPARLAQRLREKTYTVMAFPNGCSSVIVNVSSTIGMFENSRTSVDWLMAVYALRTCALLDMWCGAMNGASGERHYGVRDIESTVIPTPSAATEATLVPYRGVLTVEEAQALVTAMAGVVAEPRPEDGGNWDDGLDAGIVAGLRMSTDVLSVLRSRKGIATKWASTYVPFAGLHVPRAHSPEKADAEVHRMPYTAVLQRAARSVTTDADEGDLVQYLLRIMHHIRDEGPEPPARLLPKREVREAILLRWGKNSWGPMIDDPSSWADLTERVMSVMASSDVPIAVSRTRYYQGAIEKWASREENSRAQATPSYVAHFVVAGLRGMCRASVMEGKELDQFMTILQFLGEGLLLICRRHSAALPKNDLYSDPGAILRALHDGPKFAAKALTAVAARMLATLRHPNVKDVEPTAVLAGFTTAAEKILQWYVTDFHTVVPAPVVRAAPPVAAASAAPAWADSILDDIENVGLGTDVDVPSGPEFELFCARQGLDAATVAEMIIDDDDTAREWEKFKAQGQKDSED